MNEEKLKTKLEWALYYQKMGLSIIPTGAGTDRKKPLLAHWKPYQERCASLEEVKEWWKKWPEANPALVTGKVSGIVALDLDKKYNRTSKEFQIPVTASAKSGNGGEHFFFKYPSGISVKSGSAISGEGVDFRGDGGYILLSPSVNDNGGSYEWIIPLESKDDLTEMPEWLINLVKSDQKEKKWLLGKDGVSEGSRNETAASMAGKIISNTDNELLESMGWEQYQVWNNKNIPPLKIKELRVIWESIKQKHLENTDSQIEDIVEEKIDISEFKEIEINEVCKIIEATVKKDDENKIVTFLSMVITYTEDSQMNIFFNAPSSTGKSHIPLSVVELFPKKDVITLAYCSPTAFFHDHGAYNKEKNEIVVDLSKKIIIFTDMPDQSLISRLRPLLSHDQKESRLKITDKQQRGGIKTKNIVLIGFPSVYFCSAEMRVDEQESTRFLMLSPSVEHDKIYQGIQQSIFKASDSEKFNQIINDDPERNQLKRRIIGIKQENIFDVKIEDVEYIEKLYLKEGASVRPRQQRDIKKVISIIKGFALLNVWFRKRDGDYIWASRKDIEDGFKLWDKLSYGQDYGLAPYLFDIYSKVIMVLWNEPDESSFSSLVGGGEKRKFITRKEILKKHFQIYKTPLGMQKLRQQILPQLEQVGLIAQEKGGDDMREMVVIPLETGIEDDI